MGRPKKLPAGMHLRGHVYYARFKAGGRMVRKRLSSDFEAAKTILNDLRARADKADFGLLDNNYPWAELRREFLTWVKQALRNPREYARDLDHLEAFQKLTNVREITPQFIIGYRQWRLTNGNMGKPRKPKRIRAKSIEGGATPVPPAVKPITPRTINKEVGTLRAMLNKAVEWGKIGSNPIAGIKPLRHDSLAKQRRALTAEEVQALFAASPAHLRPALRMFLCTGIRREELVTLRFSDVDLDRRAVTIRPEIAKSHKAREIPLDDSLVEMIAELAERAAERQPVPGKTARQTELQAASFTRDHVFVTTANTPWRNNLLRVFYSACKRAGIADGKSGGAIDLHSLRATFTTLAIENGASPKAIQSILGHSTLGLTMGVYARATERSKRDAIAALPFAKASAPAHVITLPVSRPEEPAKGASLLKSS